MPDASSAMDLLPSIPLSAKTVVNVGASGAALLSAYRRLNPRARLFGIAANARTEPPAPTGPDAVDCFVYDNVLGVLADPWALIRCHAARLRDDGVMLIRVPNADHWRRTERLLRGAGSDPDAVQDTGGMTAAELRDGLRRAGLTVCDIAASEPDPEAAQRFVEAIGPALSALGLDRAAYGQRSRGSHLICRARKHSPRPLVLAGTMLAPVGGVSHVRVVHPLQALASDPAVFTSVTDRVNLEAPEDDTARIFILHRPSLIGAEGLETLRRLAAAGYLVVTEFDDHPEHFQMMRHGGELSFLGVHAVQTSTAAMGEILRRYNPEVAVFPNAVTALPDIRNFADDQRLTLFFGALNREPDWQLLMPALNAVAAKAGHRLTFQVVHDHAFFQALRTPYKTFTPTCDYETYSRILGGSEISFMPLGDTAFNRAKSDLKFIEAGAHRTASLASSVVYGDSIEDGRTGLLFRDPVEFEAGLMRLVAMPDLARALGDAALRYVMDHRMLAYQVAPRIGWYRSLWNRREALEAARRVRVQRRMGA